MKTKKKLVFVHGGEVFKNEKEFINYLLNKDISLQDYLKLQKSWKQKLTQHLQENSVAPLILNMPCRKNAKYKHWETWFQKHLPFFDEKTVFVGHSLGGSFLLQFFSKHNIGAFPQIHLVAPAMLDLAGFKTKASLASSLLTKQFSEIFVYHSQDDFVVPFQDSEKIVDMLSKFATSVSQIKFIKFKSKGHFILNNSPNLEKRLNFDLS